jgi:hypothetical protein
MIAFDLTCEKDHVFEGWFESAAAFEEQLARRMVECPICGSAQVTRRFTTFGIKKNRPDAKPTDEQLQQTAHKIVHFLETNFEDVGPRFATEALKMAYGAAEPRNIRGVTSEEEEKTLVDEGIPFFKLPLPDKKNQTDEQ